MKAIVEVKDGLYVIRIYGKERGLYDVYVVDEIELKTCSQDRDLGEALVECTL